jgi:hypothetical protein
MAIIVRFARTLILLLAALVGSLSGLGRTQPVLAAPWFTYPDGTACIQPCLFGIRPDDTSYQSAIQILGMHPFTRAFDFHLGPGPAIIRGRQMSVILVTGTTSEIVRVSLVRNADAAFPPGLSSLGEVILRMGRPILVSVGAETTLSYYEAGQLMFMHLHRRPGEIGPDDELQGIFIDARSSADAQIGTTWKGFGSGRHYRVRIGGA